MPRESRISRAITASIDDTGNPLMVRMVGAVTEPIRAAPPTPNRLAVARRAEYIEDGGGETTPPRRPHRARNAT
ncbi:hypothetical protein GCM10010402_03090 [Actinomadura luteofluorescens]